MPRTRHFPVWCFCWTLTLTLAACAAAERDIVCRDWYFRESLAAIRDWEDMLGRWEQETPESARTPALPVPATGEGIAWPNPIPLRLLPSGAASDPVRVRCRDGKMIVERSPAGVAGSSQEVAAGAEVLGYQHPGGGGKDQWYHAYHREFDRLTRFRPQPARFVLRVTARGVQPPEGGTTSGEPARLALQATGALDLQRGKNELTIEFRSAVEQPVTLLVHSEFRTPRQTRDLGRQTIELAAGANYVWRLPLNLDAPGGGLVLVTIQDGDQTYWLPLLTHVEQVQAVLASIGQILADKPDAAAAQKLGDLQRRAEQWSADGVAAGLGWRELFEQASSLRDGLLLSRLSFDALLLAKRKPFFSEQPFMDAHHLFNRPGGGIYRLSPVRPDGRVTPVVGSLGEGVYRDLCLHWDARRLLFAWGNGSDSWDGKLSYHIYEVGVDGGGLRQITTGPKNDCEPFYLPNGQIGFTSDRSEHFVMCGGDRHSPNLFVTDPGGTSVRRLSFNVFNDYNPAVLPDGRIIYGRWEYNERSVTSLHNPFTMHPDGRMVSPYYGNATIRPNVVMFPRPVPGSNLVIALFTAHHGQTHGAVGLIDVRRGIDGPQPLTVLTPNVPITGEKAEDSRAGWFSDPLPLDEHTWMCSYTPTVLPWLETSWALYVADRHGNLGLVYRDPEISCAEPVPLVPRPQPHVLPPAPAETDSREADATLVLADVYQGLPDVPRGTAKYLRILEDVPRESVHRGGVVCTSGTLIFTVKRVLGTVPVEPDGSAAFVVPANRNVYFEVLDADRLEIQRMRSVLCLKPGEQRGCIGCHEPRNHAPSTRRGTFDDLVRRGSPGPAASPTEVLPGTAQSPPSSGLIAPPAPPAVLAVLAALRREPSRPVPPPWGTQILSYLRDIQPVLNARCVRCHAFDRPANGIILTDDLTDQFCVSYEELLPYLTVAISNRWDHPDDVVTRPPYTYGSKVSELTKILRAGHHDVQLTSDDWERLVTWIDANGVYYDRYESEHFDHRHIFAGPVRQELGKVFQRRCATCHGTDDGQHDTWWLSVNRRDVRLSRALAAPLSAAAGGWSRCQGTVFADISDPDYQALLAVLTALRTTLDEHPREDLLSLRGTDAERQVVELPPPPKPAAPAADEAGDGWVDLLTLPWESAASGWTPNKDGQPRRNRDVMEQPLRLGGRRYSAGLGTHAPSEIVYRIEGRYGRFTCVVGAAERGGSVVFQVYGDDRKLFDSGTLHGLSEVHRVDLPLVGVQKLRLIVTDAGDGYIHDMANWANPRLLRVQ